METIRIELEKNSYDICLGYDLLPRVCELIRRVHKGKKVVVITDDHVNEIYGKPMMARLKEDGFVVKFVSVFPGERSKSFATAIPIFEELVDFEMTRSDIILAFGGGVVGDLAGFVASTYLRGIPFIQIPTTLLAQVDSSIGGKVGINLEKGKNLVGSFYQPKLVLIDTKVLETLPEKNFSDGMGEVIKYGFIKDKALIETLELYKDKSQLKQSIIEVVCRCCKIKKLLVEEDERDMGARMLLNFGHTLGHAIEKNYDYEKYTHGEGVAIGMKKITDISESLGLTAVGTAKRIQELLRKYELPYEIEIETSLLDTIKMDKKNIDEELNLVLIQEIGKAILYKTTPDFFYRRNHGAKNKDHTQ